MVDFDRIIKGCHRDLLIMDKQEVRGQIVLRIFVGSIYVTSHKSDWVGKSGLSLCSLQDVECKKTRVSRALSDLERNLQCSMYINKMYLTKVSLTFRL